MSQPKLYYFNIIGRGDLVRLTFKLAREDFEDIRFSHHEWMEKYRQMSPNKTAPFLVLPDGTVKVQSTAIAREIAKRHGLMGQNNEEYYKIERMINQTQDVIVALYAATFESPKELKESAKSAFIDKKAPVLLDAIVDFLKENSSGFVVGNSLTLGDICVFSTIDQLRKYCPDLNVDSKYPALKQQYDLVLKNCAEIDDYVKNRPAESL